MAFLTQVFCILHKLNQFVTGSQEIQQQNQQLQQCVSMLRTSHKEVDQRNSILTKTGNELLNKSKLIERENKKLSATNAKLQKLTEMREQQIQAMQLSMHNQMKQIAQLENYLRKSKSKEKELTEKYRMQLQGLTDSKKKATTNSAAESLIKKMKALVKKEQAIDSPLSDAMLFKLFKDRFQSSLGIASSADLPTKRRKNRQSKKKTTVPSIPTPTPTLPSAVEAATSSSSQPFKTSFQLMRGTVHRNFSTALSDTPSNIYLRSPLTSPQKNTDSHFTSLRGSPSTKQMYTRTASPRRPDIFASIDNESSPQSLYASEQIDSLDLYSDHGHPLEDLRSDMGFPTMDAENIFMNSATALDLEQDQISSFSNLDDLEIGTGLNLTSIPSQGTTSIDILPQNHDVSNIEGGTPKNILPTTGMLPEAKNQAKISKDNLESLELPADCICLLPYKHTAPLAWIPKALRLGHHISLECKYQKFKPSKCECAVRGESGEHTNNLCPVYRDEECLLCKQMFLSTKNVQHQKHVGNKCGGWIWKQHLCKQVSQRPREEIVQEERYDAGQAGPVSSLECSLRSMPNEQGVPELHSTA